MFRSSLSYLNLKLYGKAFSYKIVLLCVAFRQLVFSLSSHGVLSLGIKRPGREAGRSPPSSAEVKECVELYPTPQYSMVWCSVKARGQYYVFIMTVIEMLYAISYWWSHVYVARTKS
jgi:hypothetical protein